MTHDELSTAICLLCGSALIAPGRPEQPPIFELLNLIDSVQVMDPSQNIEMSRIVCEIIIHDSAWNVPSFSDVVDLGIHVEVGIFVCAIEVVGLQSLV